MWSQSLYLVRKEIKYYWPAYIFTLLASMFMGFVAASLLSETITFMIEDVNVASRYLLDLLLIGIAPSFATIFISGPYLRFSTIKEDPFSKRMAYYRTMPISVQVIARSRTILMLMTLLLMSAALYTVMFVALSIRGDYTSFMSTQQFIMFILLWFSFALALGGMNPYIEYGLNGKALHTIPYFFVGLFTVIALSFYMIKGQGIVEWSITLIQQYGWNVIFVAALVALIASVLWHKLLTKRLLHRDYM